MQLSLSSNALKFNSQSSIKVGTFDFLVHITSITETLELSFIFDRACVGLHLRFFSISIVRSGTNCMGIILTFLNICNRRGSRKFRLIIFSILIFLKENMNFRQEIVQSLNSGTKAPDVSSVMVLLNNDFEGYVFIQTW